MIKLLKLLICNWRARVVLFFVCALLLAPGATTWAAGVGSVCFKESCFQPEIVRTSAEKQHGLMGRVRLMPGEGMLFVYDHQTRPDFWMKNMRIPLDFIWLDGKNRVVDLSQNIPECGSGTCPIIASHSPVQYVLEVSTGSVEKSGIKIGDQAIIKEDVQ